MESRVFDPDPTLPLDFDGSSNMDHLPEVTFGQQASEASLHESQSQSPGHGLLLPTPMASKINSGRMSPVRGRTMKEYDQQITDLKKENFSLKLRIYFLEERMQQKYGDGEDVFKTNIELKVNVQSLKNELENKQELLRKASQAMEVLTSSQQSDVESVCQSLEEQHRKYTQELRDDLKKAIQDAEDAREEVEESRERMSQLELRLQEVEMDREKAQMSLHKVKDAMEAKDRELSALQLESDSQVRSLEEAQQLMKAAEAAREAATHRVQQMEKEIRRRGRDVETLSTALKDSSMIDGHSFLAPAHLQDVVDDQQDDLTRLEAKVTELEGQVKDKDGLIGRLEDEMKEKEKGLKEARNRAEQLTAELEQEKHYGVRRDKTIQGLVHNIFKKEKEVSSAKAKISKSETALKTLQAELHDSELARQQDLQQLQQQWEDSEGSNRRLQTQLQDANQQVESMIRSLGKKEGELAGFREQLQRANQALEHSEQALEGLQEQLEKERNQSHDRFEKQTQEYQRTLEDYLQQMSGKDGLMAQMTQQMHAKDQQLTDLMDLLTDDNKKGQKALLQRLEDDLNTSSTTARAALEEKQAEVEAKAREVREARQALQDRDRQLEQTSRQLIDARQDAQKLDLQNRQHVEDIRHLSDSLLKAQNALEDSIHRHSHALEEKDGMVQRLQKALAEKERLVEELTNQNPSNDKQQQQLRAQLREKDQLVEELRTDCVQATCEKERLNRAMQARLADKDREIDDIQGEGRKLQKELTNRQQEIQDLGGQLARKELQLQGLTNQLQAAEQVTADRLRTLQTMLDDKERAIKALMEGMGEKERLLRLSQQNLTEDAKAQLAQMDSLLTENARLRRLLQDRQDAASEDNRPKSGGNQGEALHSSYHETITINSNTDIDTAQRLRLLEEQVHGCMGGGTRQGKDSTELFVNLHTHSNADGREEGRGGSSEGDAWPWSSLRQRLGEGVDGDQLHRSLLGHTARGTDHLTSGENSVEGDYHRVNVRPAPRGDDCDDGSPVPQGSATSKAVVSADRSAGDGVTPPSGKASSLAIQTSPFLTHTLFAEGGPLSKERRGDDGGQDDAGQGAPPAGAGHQQAVVRQVSQDSVSTCASLSADQLCAMSAPVLRDLVSQLQEDLLAAAQRNARLQGELHARTHTADGGGGRPEGVAMPTDPVADLQAQVDSLQTQLKLRDEETAQLRQHLGIPPQPSSPDTHPATTSTHLQGQARDLRLQVKDMDRVNSILQRRVDQAGPLGEGNVVEGTDQDGVHTDCPRLSRNGLGQHTEELSDSQDGNGTTISHSATQPASCLSDSSQSSWRLPVERPLLDEVSRNTNHRLDSGLSQVSSLLPCGSQSSDSEWTPRLVRGGEGAGVSRLPRLARVKLAPPADPAASQPMVSVARRLTESQDRVHALEDRLVATEGTVRYMSQRLRHYRHLLQAAKVKGTGQGSPLSLSTASSLLPRSNSESCLFPPSGLSLSLSCNNLDEVTQCSGRSMMDSLHQDGSKRDRSMPAADTSPQLGARRGVSPRHEEDGGSSTSPLPPGHHPDSTLDNLTYYSFSESILPLRCSEGHHDSLWSSPRDPQPPHPLAQRAHDATDHARPDRAARDQQVYDGNGFDSTLHLGSPGGEGEGGESESSRLRAHLSLVVGMNRTMREELGLYETLCRSMGVQVSGKGDSSCATDDSLRGLEGEDREIRLLQLHLAELRRLRNRMEQLDTEALNAVQVTSQLNDLHVRRLRELEAELDRLREELAQQKALAERYQATITQHESVITTTTVAREQQEKEVALLRENLSALQECEAQRRHQAQGEVSDLRLQLRALEEEAESARRQARDLEAELEDSQQRRESCDAKFSRSQGHLHDLQSQLAKASRRVKTLEGQVAQANHDLGQLQDQKEAAETELAAQLAERDREGELLRAEGADRAQRLAELEALLADKEQELAAVAAELEEARRLRERAEGEAQAERARSVRLETERAGAEEESRQQRERAAHFQDRMAHYQTCVAQYQHRVKDCEQQVEKLRSTLDASQSHEREAEVRVQEVERQSQILQARLREAESRTHTSDSRAHRADTLARTLEARLRDMESKVQESEEVSRQWEVRVKESQLTVREAGSKTDVLEKEKSDLSAKLKKRDAQLSNLVPAYKQLYSQFKETNQVNKTLRTEIRLYETMKSQEVNRDKKEELIQELLRELSQTRRLAEDLISRMEHSKRNTSPASTGGSEAADGRPSPELRDSLTQLSEANLLRLQTDTHNSSGHSHASSLSARSQCSLVSTPPGSEDGGRRPELSPNPQASGRHSDPHHKDDAGEGTATTLAAGSGHDPKVKVDGLKYWQDRPPHPSLSLPPGGPRVEVDSDLRRLFAVSDLEGYEKLKRESGEVSAILSSMQARMAERLKAFTGMPISESVEYSTLRELQMSAENLRICAEEESRLLGCFWLTQLPPLNAHGQFYDPKLAEETESLRVELRKQKSRYDLLVHTVREQQERLHATNALRKKWESTLYKQYEHFVKHQLVTSSSRTSATVPPFISSLSAGMEGARPGGAEVVKAGRRVSHTSGILEQSKENFDQAGLVPRRKKSPRKTPTHPIKDKN